MTKRIVHLLQTVRFAALATGLAALLAATGGCTHLASADSDALWKIVGGQCVPEASNGEHPGPCTEVDLQHRYAVLKDINGHTQYLLIPTDRVPGIESPEILYAGSPEYWAAAWKAGHYVQERAGVPLAADQLGLEINASTRRSQNQLHIHVDCMRTDITAALAAHRNDPPDAWQWDTLDGKRYRIMRVASLVDRDNPFRVVNRDLDAQQGMASQTILVTGAGQDASHDGWLIVNSSSRLKGGTGTAEGLLDHTCRLAHGS
ncbi:CDP-diacylglycerol diphosphatase [Burkholderia sp. WAC0059]|uniref:CDP-diacylglycerol diphosphatase n=1 Tax=Burkholderia sp. WAC0059 TaxID=2066022 RepID=UPI000C7F1DA1|nr:CDP-diacylglycerol diphosphatase [Burkholderia sp. WAC0059]PLZ04210.1 CDP-diacylglycerol diphosphatase [Burkholderia sp. WAC0059]